MSDKTKALLAVKPGRVRDGLKILLRSMLWLEIVGEAEDQESLNELVDSYRPELLLLEADLLGNESWPAIQQVRPQTRSIVLVRNLEQHHRAKAAGADNILLTGFPTSEFFAAIQNTVGVTDQQPQSQLS